MVGDCPVQTTEWSPCSRECGWGIRERITNDNEDCEMKKETKLCQLKPCHHVTSIKTMLNVSWQCYCRHSIHRVCAIFFVWPLTIAVKLDLEVNLCISEQQIHQQSLFENDSAKGSGDLYIQWMQIKETVQAKVLWPMQRWSLLRTRRNWNCQCHFRVSFIVFNLTDLFV